MKIKNASTATLCTYATLYNICLLESRMRRPCLPRRISFMKLIIPTQMIGDTSTPPTGGTAFLVGFRMGSVGTYAMTQGSREMGTEK